MSEKCEDCGALIALVGLRHRCIPRISVSGGAQGSLLHLGEIDKPAKPTKPPKKAKRPKKKARA